MHKAIPKVIVAVTALLSATVAQAQLSQARLQLRADAGIFSPLGDQVKNIYGSGPVWQLTLNAALSEQSRLKLGYARIRLTGNPFYEFADFITRNSSMITLNGLSMLLEITGKTTNNPKVYLGAGVIYEFGSEKIIGNSSNRGDGLGLIFTMSPEFRISRTLFVSVEAGLRLLEVTFQGNGRIPYTFNLSGGTLSAGLAYRFGQP